MHSRHHQSPSLYWKGGLTKFAHSIKHQWSILFFLPSSYSLSLSPSLSLPLSLSLSLFRFTVMFAAILHRTKVSHDCRVVSFTFFSCSLFLSPSFTWAIYLTERARRETKSRPSNVMNIEREKKEKRREREKRRNEKETKCLASGHEWTSVNLLLIINR